MKKYFFKNNFKKYNFFLNWKKKEEEEMNKIEFKLCTLLKVAAFPMVGDLMVKCSFWQKVGSLSRWAMSSVLCGPAGTCSQTTNILSIIESQKKKSGIDDSPTQYDAKYMGIEW